MLKRLFLAALFALAVPASATLQLSANINGTLFNCVDQAACDTNLLVGQMALNPLLFGGVEILGSSQTQNIGVSNFLNTSSFQIINHNTAAASVTLAVGGTNFLGPVNSFDASGSGTWQNAGGSTVGLTYYGDAANAQGADSPLDLPGLLLASFADSAVGATDSFSFSQNGAFLAGPLYSMTLGTSGTLSAWNGIAGAEPTLVGRSQAIVTTQQAVPEPGTLALLGLAFAGLGFMRKRA